MRRATALACALALAVSAGVVAAPANAQTSLGELSSGSSTSSKNDIDFERDPDNPGVDVPPQTPTGSVYTGSAPITIGLAVALTALAVQLAVDSIPPIRQAVDDAARAAGLEWVYGSSAGNRIFDIPAFLNMVQNFQPNVQLPR